MTLQEWRQFLGDLPYRTTCATVPSQLPAVVAPVPGPSPATTQGRATPIVYVAIGDGETTGMGLIASSQTYPALLAHYLPRTARSLILGSDYEVAGSARYFTLPRALAAHPTLVTIWVGWADLAVGTAPASYRADLDSLLAAFQRQHARVFIANMPDMRIVPYEYGGGQTLAQPAIAYNGIIAALAAKYGATVVDVYAASKLLFPHPELEGNQYAFNSQGEAVLAQIFYRVMHSHGAL
jgi:hypothetical protein